MQGKVLGTGSDLANNLTFAKACLNSADWWPFSAMGVSETAAQENGSALWLLNPL
jgi:hypothetical protein